MCYTFPEYWTVSSGVWEWGPGVTQRASLPHLSPKHLIIMEQPCGPTEDMETLSLCGPMQLLWKGDTQALNTEVLKAFS